MKANRFHTRYGGGYPPTGPLLLTAVLLVLQAFAPPRSHGQSPNQSPDPAALVSQAQQSIVEGDTANAHRLLAEALAASPNQPAANILLGHLLLTEHHLPEAMDRFETVLATNLRNPEARAGELSAATALALQARNAGHPEAALLCLQHARDLLPDDPTLLTDIGIQAHAMHLLRPASEALNAALALHPADPTALYALARVELDSEQFDLAEQHFRALLAQHPEDATAHFGLGHLLAMRQRIPEAKAEFQRSIDLQPSQTESFYQLGQIALDAHEDSTAKPLFNRILARSPSHAGALTGLGILAYRAKLYSSARNVLTQATEAEPGYQPAHYYLGLTLNRLGDKPAADRELQRAVDLAHQQQGKGDPVPANTLP